MRFWRHAIAALERARPGSPAVLPLLGPPPPPSFEGLVTAVADELTAEPDQGQVVLVTQATARAPELGLLADPPSAPRP